MFFFPYIFFFIYCCGRKNVRHLLNICRDRNQWDAVCVPDGDAPVDDGVVVDAGVVDAIPLEAVEDGVGRPPADEPIDRRVAGAAAEITDLAPAEKLRAVRVRGRRPQHERDLLRPEHVELPARPVSEEEVAPVVVDPVIAVAVVVEPRQREEDDADVGAVGDGRQERPGGLVGVDDERKALDEWSR